MSKRKKGSGSPRASALRPGPPLGAEDGYFQQKMPKEERNESEAAARSSPDLRAPVPSAPAASGRLTDGASRRKMSVKHAKRAARAAAEFPLPKFRHSPDACARNQQRPTATRGWSKLTPVRPLCAPGACEQQRRARTSGRVSGGGSSHLIFVREGTQKNALASS